MPDDSAKHESLFISVIEGSPYAKILVNESGNIVLVNAQAEKLFGYARSELLDRSIEMLVPERFRLGHPRLRHSFNEERSSRTMGAGRDLYGLCKDGSEIPIEIGLNPIDTDTGRFTVTAITDISERKRAEAERILHFGVQQYAAKLEQLNTELTDAMRQKSEFIGTISHELRTPLAAIIGATELLTRVRLDDDEQFMLQTITQAADTLLALIDNLLDFSKIEAATMSLQTARFDIESVLQGAVETVGAPAREKGIAIRTSVEPGIPTLYGDADRLGQVLLNLLSNAVKFTERGSVTLRVAPADISERNIVLRFEIQDTGIGIDLRSLATLFEPFVQADSSTSRRFQGAGLGLSIAKRLVELMSGRINVQSTIGLGSTFTFTARFALEPAPIA